MAYGGTRCAVPTKPVVRVWGYQALPEGIHLCKALNEIAAACSATRCPVLSYGILLYCAPCCVVLSAGILLYQGRTSSLRSPPTSPSSLSSPRSSSRRSFASFSGGFAAVYGGNAAVSGDAVAIYGDTNVNGDTKLLFMATKLLFMAAMLLFMEAPQISAPSFMPFMVARLLFMLARPPSMASVLSFTALTKLLAHRTRSLNFQVSRAIGLRERYAMSGTEVAYGARCDTP
eukprot:1370655-Rhodomonas_salina.1